MRSKRKHSTYIWILLLPVHTFLLLLHVQISLSVLLPLLPALHRRHEGNPLGRTFFSCASVAWEEEGVQERKGVFQSTSHGLKTHPATYQVVLCQAWRLNSRTQVAEASLSEVVRKAEEVEKSDLPSHISSSHPPAASPLVCLPLQAPAVSLLDGRTHRIPRPRVRGSTNLSVVQLPFSSPPLPASAFPSSP